MASREVISIVQFVQAKNLPARITATVGKYISPTNPCSPHSPGSLHCAEGTDGAGLAVDFGGAEVGTGPVAAAQMVAIFNALASVAPQLAELIHNGPGIGQAVKNGRWVDPVRVYGQTVWDAHRNHVHVAVPRGTFLAVPAATPPISATAAVEPVHDYEEAAVKTTMVHIGPLDKDGNGWADWQPGLGRDPNIVAVTLLGPSPPDDGGYWPGQAKVNLSAQPRGGSARIVVRGGTPGDTVTAWVTVS